MMVLRIFHSLYVSASSSILNSLFLNSNWFFNLNEDLNTENDFNTEDDHTRAESSSAGE